VAATELAFTLEAVQTGADPSFSVNVQAGSNRLFVVAIGLPYSYTVINGVTLNGTALTAVTDGTTTAQGNDTDFGHGVKFWALKEASFPANGSRTLAIDTAGAGTEGYWIAHWQLANIDQTTTFVDVAVTSHTSTDPLSTSGLAATAADQECFAIGCSTDPATGTTLTIDGTNITQVTVDNAPPSSFPHYWKAGHKTVASGSRTVTVEGTGSQSSNLIVAFILGTLSSGASGSAAFASDAATMAASGTASRLGTAAFSSDAATMAASGTASRVATASFASDAATMAATGAASHPGSAAFASDAATMAASGTVGKSGAAAFSSDEATMVASGTVSRTATAAFSSDAATMSASGHRTLTATAEFVAQAATMAATGALVLPVPGRLDSRVSEPTRMVTRVTRPTPMNTNIRPRGTLVTSVREIT
jgi:hypothetical protein